MMSVKQEPWYLTGPTASGKTSVGIELARRLDAEIISMDSMALFRGMDIGTAKPNADERRQVRHHLVDVLDPHEDFSLAQYLDAAGRCSAEITGRGHQVLFVGGTPLYLKGLLRGVFDGPPADWELRKQLLGELESRGAEFLHAELVKIDPEAAARIHVNDSRRLVRALEVHRKTGQAISVLQQQFSVARSADECRVFVLAWDRDVLCRRIDQRVDAMFDAGLIEEVALLLGGGRSLSRTALQAVGYREVLAHLKGQTGRDEAIELVKCHTRQLAKRQMTWFRSLSECRFLPLAEPFDARAVAERLVASV
jgi:tRNA dimethylallyltransferase